ncbi:MAG: hypothetical protein R3270_03660 [Gammaproteobacteria bacterium]|nr:hypothetical protein [Gammaproteobacteria bacterium]
MFRRITTVIATLGAAIVLQSCTATDSRPDMLAAEAVEQSGVVFGSFTRVEGLDSYSRYDLRLRSLDDDEVIRIQVVDGGFPERPADASTDGLARFVFATSLAPGQYELLDVRAVNLDAYRARDDFRHAQRTWDVREDGPAIIDVQAGEAVYLGAHVVIPQYSGVIWNQFAWNALYDHVTNREADEVLAREIYPNLPAVAEPDWLPEETLDAEEVQLFARAINPESRFWDASAWTRVTDLERERRR